MPRVIASPPSTLWMWEIDQSLRISVLQLDIAPQLRAIPLVSPGHESTRLQFWLDPTTAVISNRACRIQQQKAGDVAGGRCRSQKTIGVLNLVFRTVSL